MRLADVAAIVDLADGRTLAVGLRVVDTRSDRDVYEATVEESLQLEAALVRAFLLERERSS